MMTYYSVDKELTIKMHTDAEGEAILAAASPDVQVFRLHHRWLELPVKTDEGYAWTQVVYQEDSSPSSSEPSV